MSEYDKRRTNITKAISQLEGLIENERLSLREGRPYQMSPLSINYMINAFEQSLALVNDFKRIENKLDTVEKETSKVIELFSTWKKVYQPVLDRAAEEYDMLDKVKKVE